MNKPATAMMPAPGPNDANLREPMPVPPPGKRLRLKSPDPYADFAPSPSPVAATKTVVDDIGPLDSVSSVSSFNLARVADGVVDLAYVLGMPPLNLITIIKVLRTWVRDAAIGGRILEMVFL